MSVREANRASPWSAGRLDDRPGGPRLLFGSMFEDWRIENAVFPMGGRVLCIASAGDTALALADRGFEVTAVDVNPLQVAYVRERCSGGAVRLGTVDRWLRLVRAVFPAAGLPRRRLREFLQLADPQAQLRYWKKHLDRAPARLLLRGLCNRACFRLAYSRDFVQSCPRAFHRCIRARIERGISRHPNRHNPYAWRLFLGQDGSENRTGRSNGRSFPVVCADVLSYLCSGAARKPFDGFSLSNILDGPDGSYQTAVLDAVRRSASPGAVVVLRTLGEVANRQAQAWAGADRSLLWGGIHVFNPHRSSCLEVR